MSGRPRKPLPKANGREKKLKCGRCEDFKPLSLFPIFRPGREGRGSWCIPCKRAYDHDYYKNRGKKKQPKKDEMMQAIDREPRSDEATYRINKQLYDERKNRKQNCAYPGCITLIGYHQDRLCRLHEREMNEEKMARKLAKK